MRPSGPTWRTTHSQLCIGQGKRKIRPDVKLQYNHIEQHSNLLTTLAMQSLRSVHSFPGRVPRNVFDQAGYFGGPPCFDKPLRFGYIRRDQKDKIKIRRGHFRDICEGNYLNIFGMHSRSE
ncbi:hypothetical protein AG1IA_03549 [Rhizoctonia solani AG-1 IA]|uniref:Uncharacterized protein n=1 Tax=Thanatephorus cucumeris (strain AG1-IA) TaxID=983506 RepID=L8X070_THACA|nr:hypothetical protein AG1IA_03549 [Rhizoctonia solani AG-1 IA]